MPPRAFDGAEAASFALRAPHAAAAVVLAAPGEKAARPPQPGRGLRVGTVREAAKSVPATWAAVEGGWVARFRLASPGAAGLRARIAMPEGLARAQVAARGADGRVEGFEPAGVLAWTPWTPGEEQEVEVFTRALPARPPVVEAIVHFDVSPLDKGTAGACSPDVACPTGDAARDAAIAERSKSVALVNFVEGTEARVCTGTLLNTEKYPVPFLVTANHCIATTAAAASVTTHWFNEAASCGSSDVSTAARQVAGGATLVFTSHGPDSTLLQLRSSPPSGAVFSGWNAARLAEGDEVVSISHPQGDVKKYALGAQKQELQVRNYPQAMYGVAFTRGVTEGGSSGSALFTDAGGSLQLRGILSGSTFRSGGPLSCANADVEEALYGRFEVFHPQIADYIAATPPVRTDDYGDRLAEAQRIVPEASSTHTEVSYPGRIEHAGDVDVFRVVVPQNKGTLSLWTTGGTDTIGTLLDDEGRTIRSVNDVQSDGPDFGITQTLDPGTYHLMVAHREAQGTGPYTLKASISTVTDNYTDLWWNPKEPGWGLNLNHQGNTLFGTLYTYGRDGQPLWLVASSITRHPAGYWEGALLRASGPAFDSRPWVAPVLERVGTLDLQFDGRDKATLSYSFDGVRVSKPIERQIFSLAPLCRWSAFDRSLTTNFQDLWWNPDEPGWGLGLSHQGDILFATLFTYDEAGRDLWLVMSRGELVAEGRYLGELLRTEGPPFNAATWGSVTTTPVGTLTVQFTRGNAATITYTLNGVLVVKNIQRQVFGIPATECVAPGDE
jgi:hypothetical protein